MKTVLAFALVVFAACTDDETPPTEAQDTQGLVCASSADCSANAVCIKSSATTASLGMCVPNAPIPSTCSPDPTSTASNTCPAGMRCNAVCSTTGIAGYKCEPAGVPTHVCPIKCTPVPNSTAGTCPANHHCIVACANAAHICVPTTASTQICL